MNARLATTLFVAGSMLVPTAALAWGSNGARDTTHAVTQSVKRSTSDATVTTKVKAAFVKDPQVSAMGIHVDTNDGVVKLSGNANSQAEADWAVSLAQNTSGVTSVDNEIHVTGAGAPRS